MVHEDGQEDAMVVAARTMAPSPPSWLEDLYRAHSRLVLRSAYRVTGDATEAEEVLQTVFLRLMRRKDAPAAVEAAAPYLRRAAVNAALDAVASRRTRAAVPLQTTEPLASPTPGPERDVMAREALGHLRAALAELPRRWAEAFTLRYLEGLDNRQIARLQGTSAAVVAVTLSRTRARLRRELGPVLGGHHDG